MRTLIPQHVLSTFWVNTEMGAKKDKAFSCLSVVYVNPPSSPKIWGCWQGKLKWWWWWERGRRLLGRVKIKIVGEKHDLIKHKTWRTQARAIRDDKAATVDFHIGFGFLGNPCRGKFSQLHNCCKQKKEIGQKHRENKAFPNSEQQNKHLDETLYTQTFESD